MNGDATIRAAPATLVARARRCGVGELSDGELLALVGGDGRSVPLEGEPHWTRYSADEWSTRRGTSSDGGARLAAAFELGRRAERARHDDDPVIDGPERAAAWLAPHLRGERQECFLALLLDGRHRVRRCELVARGTLTASLVHPREVFGPALREAAAAVLVAHNHPSGDPSPSAEDHAVTRRLGRAARLLGVPLLDHLVLAGNAYRSLRREWPDWPASEPIRSASPAAAKASDPSNAGSAAESGPAGVAASGGSRSG